MNLHQKFQQLIRTWRVEAAENSHIAQNAPHGAGKTLVMRAAVLLDCAEGVQQILNTPEPAPGCLIEETE